MEDTSNEKNGCAKIKLVSISVKINFRALFSYVQYILREMSCV